MWLPIEVVPDRPEHVIEDGDAAAEISSDLVNFVGSLDHVVGGGGHLRHHVVRLLHGVDHHLHVGGLLDHVVDAFLLELRGLDLARALQAEA